MATQSLDDYFLALERIKSGRAEIVENGIDITNDAVSIEAGRGKGSIKRSRAVFAPLILAIKAAAEEQAKTSNAQKRQLDKAKTSAESYRTELEAALAREVSLLHELYEVKKQLAKLTGGKVLPIRPA